MDKETLISLAQPAATFSLALSILAIPLISKSIVDTGVQYVVEKGGPLTIIERIANQYNNCKSKKLKSKKIKFFN